MSHISVLPFLFGATAVAGVTGSARALPVHPPAAPGRGQHPAVMQLAMPFLSGGLAWLLLPQPVSWLHVVGGLATVVGVVGALLSPGGRRLARSTPDDAAPAGLR